LVDSLKYENIRKEVFVIAVFPAHLPEKPTKGQIFSEFFSEFQAAVNRPRFWFVSCGFSWYGKGMNLIRSFVALDFPADVRKKISSFIQAGRMALNSYPIRWVTENNYHLTLNFMGEITPDQVEHVSKGLAAITSEMTAFPFQITGRGLFPDTRRPSILWIGAESSPELMDLAGKAAQVARSAGIPSENLRFKPHLTIARINREKSERDLNQINPIFSSLPMAAFEPFMVDHMTLYKSELLPVGPKYTAIETFQFPTKA
jgi:RNA 2',3'-cyclic 3'-phosphodiesterase